MQKNQWISFFHQVSEETLANLEPTKINQNDKTSKINEKIKKAREYEIQKIEHSAKLKDWSNEELLNEILLVTYSSYVAMLEYRNKVWPYEYMAFARRIGEFWEPFCKLVFKYPTKELKLINPPNFNTAKTKIKTTAINYIDNLELSVDIKKELKQYYNIPWTMVDSGGINLALDLHFEQNGVHYNCDFKSGFSSNEKGNTNRLLLVASIYRSLGEKEKTILFIRQDETANNHYLQTLKNSPYWDVYCATETYILIENFTGFNIRKWIDENVDWQNDISEEFKKHLEDNNLLKYLTW